MQRQTWPDASDLCLLGCWKQTFPQLNYITDIINWFKKYWSLQNTNTEDAVTAKKKKNLFLMSILTKKLHDKSKQIPYCFLEVKLISALCKYAMVIACREIKILCTLLAWRPALAVYFAIIWFWCFSLTTYTFSLSCHWKLKEEGRFINSGFAELES